MQRNPSLLVFSILTATCAVLAGEKFDFSKLDLSKLPPAANRKNVTYEKDIKPLFDSSCIRCHGQERPKGGLRLDSLEAALKGGKDGKVIDAGDSKKSALVIAVAQLDEETAMPPKRRPGRGGPGGVTRPGGPRENTPPDGSSGNHPGTGAESGPSRPPGRPGGFGGGGFGPPPKALSPEEVGLVRAWIDQGAK